MRLIIPLFLLVFALVFSAFVYWTPSPYEIVSEYDDSERFETMFPGEAYKVGLNETGRPAFLSPQAALKQAKKDFSGGFKFIAKENHLLPPSYFTRRAYKTYGWQMCPENPDVKEECLKISQFFDLYENSYPN